MFGNDVGFILRGPSGPKDGAGDVRHLFDGDYLHDARDPMNRFKYYFLNAIQTRLDIIDQFAPNNSSVLDYGEGKG
jgi:hypothetical protein